MKGLSATLVKVRTDLTLDQEIELGVIAHNFLDNNFLPEEMENLICDEEYLIFFHGEHNKHKIDELIAELQEVADDIIEKREDITNKILKENNFSDYKFESEKIHEFIMSNTDADDVLDKVNSIGAEMLTELDRQILAA